jgi:hypothetical protein
LNVSFHCRCDPARQRRVERALLLVLAALAALAVSLSELSWPLGAALWITALGLVLLELRQPVPAALQITADGVPLIAVADDIPLLGCRSLQRYGPWLLFELEDRQAGWRRARLLPGLLAAEQRRQLGRMLARQRPAALPSV